MRCFKMAVCMVIVCALILGGAMFSTSFAEEKEVSRVGRIMFSDYYAMDGQKCAGFMETTKGEVVCVLENDNAVKLKRALGGIGGEVKVSGTMIKDPKGSYLVIDSYRHDTGLEKQIDKSREIRREVKK